MLEKWFHEIAIWLEEEKRMDDKSEKELMKTLEVNLR